MIMQIERDGIPHGTLEDFADLHGLVLRITERRDASLPRYIAAFKRVEVQERSGILCSEYGQGESEEEAVREYAKRISTKRLVVNAGSREGRVEILAWRFVEE